MLEGLVFLASTLAVTNVKASAEVMPKASEMLWGGFNGPLRKMIAGGGYDTCMFDDCKSFLFVRRLLMLAQYPWATSLLP